jgi:hypothetical protein
MRHWGSRDAYQRVFERLLRDLRAESAGDRPPRHVPLRRRPTPMPIMKAADRNGKVASDIPGGRGRAEHRARRRAPGGRRLQHKTGLGERMVRYHLQDLAADEMEPGAVAPRACYEPLASRRISETGPEGRFGAVPGRFRADFGVQSADFEIGGSSTSS